MELIQTVTVGSGGAANIEFSVPATYDDLLIVFSLRSDGSGSSFNTAIRFNGDTGNNYSYRRLLGEGSGSGISDSNTVGLPFAGRHNGATSTASTFGTTSFYIPNYRSSTAKSFSLDSANENNATAAVALIIAGLWTGTAAIDTIRLTDASGNSFVQHSSASLYGIKSARSFAKATGGTIYYDATNNKVVHVFTASGTFTPTANITCEYLVVAGGGGADVGGAGAGGYRSSVAGQASGGGGSAESTISLTSGVGQTVTVGAGGAGATSPDNNTKGSNSVFGSITSEGGGRSSRTNGFSGGSGGGGYNAASGAGAANQGFAGGSSSSGNSAGGGGGAGAVGTSVGGTNGGSGGTGVASTITGSSVIRAGGGGGAGSASGGAGGAGGGGAGTTQSGVSGTANTGGGGGGLFNAFPGGNGGSGIVIVRYDA